MKLFCYSILLFFISFGKFNGQTTFKGIVLNDKQIPINRARIFIKTGTTSKFTFTDINGKFELSNDFGNVNSVLAIASSPGYKNDSIRIPINNQQKTYDTNFELSKTSFTIEEVKIQAKRKPIEIKKDTVVYNPENFIDGSEKNVEDLLKKLPGLEVKDDGSIQFKGKTVVAVMLDGGDLFNSNYMIGTRSINPNIIDQVEAIENWSDNPILKQLNSEDKVAINLKLKKDKVSFSSSLHAETDFVKRHNLGGYALAINSLIKTFGTTNYNNIGENKSPINLSTNSLSFEEFQNLKYQSPFIIRTNAVDTQFGTDRAYRNQQWFNSSNSIIKIGSKANLKLIGSMVQDKILINNISENFYKLNDETIYTKDENEIVKKPFYLTGNLELDWYRSDKEYIEINASLSSLDENVENNLNSNFNDSYNTKTNLKNLFSKNEFIYTLKLQEKNALQIKTLYTYNKKPQNLLVNSPLPFITTSDYSSKNFQTVSTSKENLSLEMILYHKFAEDHKLNTSAGFAYQNYVLRSNFLVDDVESLEDFNNNLHYKTKNFHFDFDYAFKNNTWDITFSQNNQILLQHLLEKSNSSKNLFLNSSKLSVLKFISNKTAVFFGTEISTIPINERYLFSKNILISNRSIINNDYSLNFETQQNYSIGFNYNDSYDKQFKTSVTVSYMKNSNPFTSKFFVDENLDYTQNYRIENAAESYSLQLNLEKFVPFISSRFNLKTNYYISKYFNNINDFALTEISANSLNVNLIHQFAFNFPLKIKNTLNYINLQQQSDITQSNSINSFNMKNELVYGFNKNVYVFNFSNEFFKPDFSQQSNMFFLNFSFNFSPKESKIKYFLSGKNLLNERYNYTKYIQNYSTSFNRIELLNRIFLVGVHIDF